jgi:hypothetical protein
MSDTERKPRQRLGSLCEQMPDKGTCACQNYLLSFVQINRFVEWIARMTGSIDHYHRASTELYIVAAHDESEKENLRHEEADRIKMADLLKNNRQFLMEVALVRHIGNYLNYLTELLREIFTSRPETLRSSEKVEIEEVLRHTTMEEFICFAASRKVDILSYAPFTEMINFFNERLSLDLLPASEIPRIVEAVETRNISVHNRCIINAQYCKRTGCSRDSTGKLKELYIDTIEYLASTLKESVCRTDGEASSLFRLSVLGFKPCPWG